MEHDLYFPNELQSQFVVDKPDRVWVSDLAEVQINIKKRKEKVAILFIMDVPTNEIYAIKVFLKDSNKGSIKINLVTQVIKKLVKERNIKEELIIHTDRGAEYTSKEYYDFVQNHKYLIGSMSESSKPKQNSVAERMVRTLKNQLVKVSLDVEKVNSLKGVQEFFQAKAHFYNTKVKVKKNENHTPVQAYQALINIKANEPDKIINFNYPNDQNVLYIKEYRQKGFAVLHNKSPITLLKETHQMAFTNSQDIQEFRREISEKVEAGFQEIKQLVTPKEKVFRKHLPLRDPADNTVYMYLMRQKRKKRMRRIEWSAFRIAITLLGFAGLRVNEIKDLSFQQLNEFIDKKQMQIYQSKQNKHRTLILSQQGYKMLCGLKKDIQAVYYKRETLSGGVDKNSWIDFINKKLLDAAHHFGLNIKSHSFRVNFVTSLLKVAPLQQVSEIVGHRDVTPL